MRFFHANGLGSRVKTTNASGAVTASLDYDAFGQILSGTAAGFSYTGREYDVETGLYYYRARYYEPKDGRFMSEDPNRYGDGVNFYIYVINNPSSRVDPLGHRDNVVYPPGGPGTWPITPNNKTPFVPPADLCPIKPQPAPAPPWVKPGVLSC